MQYNIQTQLRPDRPHSKNVMPSGYSKSIGPFIYFDHLGPYAFPKQHPVFIPPHPHTGISTISYMLAGEGHHKDSLGNDLVLEEGRLNWMNAGNGIVHSEGTSRSFSEKGGKLLGFQIWTLGSDEERSNEATFQTFSKEELPGTNEGASEIHLLAGKYRSLESPVQTERDLILFVAILNQDQMTLLLHSEWEYLIYSLDGSFESAGRKHKTGEGLVVDSLNELEISSEENSSIVVLGGPTLGLEPVFNGSLVAGSTEELRIYQNKLYTEGFGKIYKQ
jgi:hypothetical protein